eukprot:snap_masked-scaffold1533_size36968-processed-gene-0.6 protein:Tk06282 transcript:snap_masked-scaffold1533_size36968-processed-gene-0.6-mRNA-1 annotation:"hypothetical protein CAPTEDRAFT_183401"
MTSQGAEKDEPDGNTLHFSSIPSRTMTEPCVLGIDEAGRGPVLGPMVYGIAFCPETCHDELKALGVDDSKVLTEEKRDKLADVIRGRDDILGWATHSLSALYLSRSMNRRAKYNLNAISHDTAIGLIREALRRGVMVRRVLVDTVGPPEKYQAKLAALFPDLDVTVAKKADSLYPCVSAASIMAKTTRDRDLKGWQFTEDHLTITPQSWGSGYPGDPVTQKFLQDNIDPVFGFPSLVRFSWKTAGSLLDSRAVPFQFEEVEPELEVPAHPSIKSYFAPATPKGVVVVRTENNFWSDHGLQSALL